MELSDTQRCAQGDALTNAPMRSLSDVIKNNPTFQYATAWLDEYRAMPPKRRVACFLHTFALTAIALYFTDLPTAEEIAAFQTQADNDDGSFESYTAATFSDWKRFAKAAVRTPLYAIPASFFVAYIGVLNILSYFVRKAPITRRNWNFHYKRLAQSFDDPRWIRDFTLDTRPLFLSWVLLVPPITIFRMIVHTIYSCLRPLVKNKNQNNVYGFPCYRLTQQKEFGRENESFYFSPFFTATIMLPFLLGIPACISLWIYWHFGIDKLLGFPSHVHGFFTTFVIIGLYFGGIGWCLTSLFFRSYFSYPLNFCSTEYDIEIYDDVIKVLPIKGWFADFATMRSMNDPKQLLWADVSSIEYFGGDLPVELNKAEQPIVELLKKITTVYESFIQKMDIHIDNLEIIGKRGRSVRINLWELAPEQKLELFRLIRKNAPSIHLNERVQNALTGSTVLSEPKYTEIWFNVLKGDSTTFREGDLEPGRSLKDGRYRVKEKLVSGGQAVIYKAVDADNKPVVLKEFQLTTGESINVQIESAKDFENESAILDQLSHPSIVKSLDVFYEEGRVYLVLENIEGQSLRELVSSEGPRPHEQILALAAQMCDILKYIHGLTPAIVHRDFTPDNLILQPDGKLKLIDFSVAQHKTELNRSVECAGKHSYTPPEQFRGAACPQSDIYALGATLYFLATGMDPLPIATSQLPNAETESSNLLSKIISTATELNLGKRFESAQWLELAIQDASGPGVSAKPVLEQTANKSNILDLSNAYRSHAIQLKPDKIKLRYQTDKLRHTVNFRRQFK